MEEQGEKQAAEEEEMVELPPCKLSLLISKLFTILDVRYRPSHCCGFSHTTKIAVL